MKSEWDIIIKPQKQFDLIETLKSIYRFKDLLFLFVRRDFVAVYKQTILGPLWFFIQPIFTTITFTIIFGNIAKISTDGVPQVLFYMSGITLWNYFSECLIKTSNTFTQNQGMFAKVYFPRLIVPLAVVLTSMLKLGIQLLLFIAIWSYYFYAGQIGLPSSYILLLPVYLIIMIFTGLGTGAILSALTTKYRDLFFLVGFGVQLLMYSSPIIYPLSVVPEKYHIWILLNPMSIVIEGFKYSLFGQGIFEFKYLFMSLTISVIIFIIGITIFKKNENTFIDTV